MDPAGRRLSLNTTGAGANQSGSETKHYVDDSDNPGYSSRKVSDKTVTTRYETTLGGDLALTITGDQVDLAVNNPHGDTVTTIPLTGDKSGTGISSWASYDEHGNVETDTTPDTGATTYAWHGADQRALNPDSGLTLMGARLYNPTTGNFTSPDPVPGGNTTTYSYPQDPVNSADTSGEWPKWMKKTGRAIWHGAKRAGKWTRKQWRNGNISRWAGYAAVGTCVIASAGVCGGVGLAAAGVSIGYRSYTAHRQLRSGMSRKKVYRRLAVGITGDLVATRIPGLKGTRVIKGRHALRRNGGVRHKSRYKHGGRYGYKHVARAAGLAAGLAWSRFS